MKIVTIELRVEVPDGYELTPELREELEQATELKILEQCEGLEAE